VTTYLWRARDRHRNATVQRIEASSAAEARKQLEADGFTELRLQAEEFVAAAKASVEAASNPEYHVELTPEEEANQVSQPLPGFWSQWGKSLRESPWSTLFQVALLAWGIHRGNWILIGLPLFFLLLFPVLHFWFGMPLRVYDRINRAKVWSRWPEVLSLCDRMTRVQRWVRMGPGRQEILRCRCQALAGMGRLEEAVQEYSTFEGSPHLAHWMYLSFLAGIYEVAWDREKSLALRQAAAEERPDNMSVWIDLAMHQAHRMADAPAARAALQRVDPALVVELGRPYLHLVEGMIRSREEDHAGALEQAERAMEGFGPFSHFPLVQSVALITRSYLCLESASLGQRDRAAQLRREVTRYLENARETELLHRIAKAMDALPAETARS